MYRRAVSGRVGRGDGDTADGVRIGAVALFEAHNDREMPVAAVFIQIAGGLAADRRLHGGIDVPRREPESRRSCPVDIDADGRLPEGIEDRQVRDTRHRLQYVADLLRGTFENLELVAVKLHGVLALHPGSRLLDVVLDVLREVEIDTGKFLPQCRRQLRGEFVLVDPGRPTVSGFQRYKKLRVEESRGVGAVVRTAML